MEQQTNQQRKHLVAPVVMQDGLGKAVPDTPINQKEIKEAEKRVKDIHIDDTHVLDTPYLY
ncbi:hypothetical protein FOD75_10745 (plasmid) [Limosilactobacillus reuteri]|uniref:Uncharacterized protein n=1 Tax=Limosilactobacillus reuteri TaxID=1598 RepID=A0A517D894_LIMRT|nr:hypothetical protein [Limosilactobacillus reuteri]QDR73569.1 hypothetical protein FOD75_10745 [Limosilactobacillus reuteri]